MMLCMRASGAQPISLVLPLERYSGYPVCGRFKKMPVCTQLSSPWRTYRTTCATQPLPVLSTRQNCAFLPLGTPGSSSCSNTLLFLGYTWADSSVCICLKYLQDTFNYTGYTIWRVACIKVDVGAV
eukprot:13171-Chlamydomonas_euryale.AAC.1